MAEPDSDGALSEPRAAVSGFVRRFFAVGGRLYAELDLEPSGIGPVILPAASVRDPVTGFPLIAL